MLCGYSQKVETEKRKQKNQQDSVLYLGITNGNNKNFQFLQRLGSKIGFGKEKIGWEANMSGKQRLIGKQI